MPAAWVRPNGVRRAVAKSMPSGTMRTRQRRGPRRTADNPSTRYDHCGGDCRVAVPGPAIYHRVLNYTSVAKEPVTSLGNCLGQVSVSRSVAGKRAWVLGA